MNNIPNILFENNEVAVVDKPSGLIVHADGKTEEETLAEWFVQRYPKAENVGEPLRLKDGGTIQRPGIVHRLDRDTSGAIILARTQEAFLSLKKQFKQRRITKKYNAFVYSWFKEEDIEGVIDRPIGRSPKDFRRRSARKNARGKLREAVTRYQMVEQGRDQKSNEPVAFLDLFPKTGRTHQLRAHLTAIHHQIVCDPIYASGRPCTLGFKRLALHATSITFTLAGEEIVVEAPFPDDFSHAFEEMVVD